MFGSDILEVAIGLVFVYFIMSLLCSTVTEYIARITAMRAKTLKDGIRKLLNDDDVLKDKIFGHPLVKGLSPKNGPGPSNLSARTFSLVLFDTVMAAGGKPGAGQASIVYSSQGGSEDIYENGRSRTLLETSRQVVESLEKNIDLLQTNEETKRVLRALLTSAKSRVNSWEGAVTEFRDSIEKWFDDSMDRVSGWYKRKSQLIVLGVAIAFCLALNVDTFVIANSLYQDTALRTSIVAAAEARAQQSISEESGSELELSELRDELSGLKLPIGWLGDAGTPNKVPGNFGGWFVKLPGLMFTALAASLGASFWFDLLSKIVNLRASGKKPDKTEETGTAAAS